MSTDGQDPKVGAIVGERYELLALEGEGSFGSVYRARHRTLGKTLALKLLHAAAAERREVVQQFQWEAQATSQIGHENIVDVFDFGHDPSHGYYIVLEYLEGVLLDDLIAEQAPLEDLRALVIARQIANALSLAHAYDVVHRDLSGRNIMVMQRYRRADLVKVLDFGVACRRTADAEAMAQGGGGIIGSPRYMSPEQIDQKSIDFRADIYALGVILYQMLTGAAPFEGASLFATLTLHLSATPVPPRELRPEIHPAVESIALRCLEKDPKRRFRSMYTLFEACDSAARTIEAARPDEASQAHRAVPRPRRADIHFLDLALPPAGEVAPERTPQDC